MKSSDILAGGGASLLLMSFYLYPLLLPDHIAAYHHTNMNSIVWGLLVDWLVCLLLSAMIPGILRRFGFRIGAVFASLLTGALIWSFVHTAVRVTESFNSKLTMNYEQVVSPPAFLRFMQAIEPYPRHIAAACSALLILFVFIRPEISRLALRSVYFGLAGFSFCLLWILPQLLFAALAPHEIDSFDHSASIAAPKRPQRLVWIVFDELSYKLIFDSPPPGQSYPNLQRFRSQSVSLANLKPVGMRTETILPSLLSGQTVGPIRSSYSGQLVVRTDQNPKWVIFDAKTTLFAQAYSTGWNPGVVGWYNPYCRTFAEVLAACSYSPSIHNLLPVEALGASTHNTWWQNAMVIPESLRGSMRAGGSRPEMKVRELNIADYHSVLANSEKLIRNGQIDFLFLHFPVPHPPGIYNRITRQIVPSGNYIDNLALTDDTLGALLSDIESTPWAGDTTVIVSSDHSFRVPLWRTSGYWTSEEEELTQGRFDQRSVFLVHFPGQDSASETSAPLTQMIEHDVISSILSRRIESPQALNSFVNSRLQPAQTATAAASVSAGHD